jgi:hypothetical protein
MPAGTEPRRRILQTTALTLVGLAGCGSTTAPTDSRSDDGTEITLASVTVQDYVSYPLAGVHPHVHRQAETQYVIVRVHTSTDDTQLSDRLTCRLDGESMPLADQQPVPWANETTDIAFAVPKTTTYDSGRVLLDGDAVHTLATEAVDRLNTPPVFAVSNVRVAPDELQAGERTEATVQFEVHNTGQGPGEFAASLRGNALSGSNTVTGTVDTGDRRQLDATTPVAGEGDAAQVRLDWGTDQWTGSIPVVGDRTATDQAMGDPSI